MTRKNCKHTQESKDKMSEAKKKGIKEGKIKIWNKGKKLHYKVWNDGLKKGESIKHYKKGHPKGMLGKKAWNKNKKGLQKSGKKGKTFEEFYGVKSKEIRKKIKQARARQVIPIKDTLIEVKIQSFLTQLHLEFYTHQYMHINHGYQCDLFIPKQETEGIIITQKTVIECDGCYWHGCPTCNLNIHKKSKEQKKRDKVRTKELIEKGFRVLRLWEHEIKPMKLNEFGERLK